MRLCHSRKIRWCRYVKYIIFYVKAILFLRSHWLSNGNMANVKQSRQVETPGNLMLILKIGNLEYKLQTRYVHI